MAIWMTGENEPAEIKALLQDMYDEHKKRRQNIMKASHIDDSLLKQISAGSSATEEQLARELDPMIRDYKSMTFYATPEELREEGLDAGYRGLLLYIDQKCKDGSICISHDVYPLIQDYITRNYDRIN